MNISKDTNLKFCHRNLQSKSVSQIKESSNVQISLWLFSLKIVDSIKKTPKCLIHPKNSFYY